MRTIYKYTLTGAHCIIEMPMGARPLSVGVQTEPRGGSERIVLWAMVDTAPEGATAQFDVWAYWTGESCDATADAAFLGTVQTGPIVHHIFIKERIGS